MQNEECRMKNVKVKADNSTFLIHNSALPRHVGIIMDGNGRWAESLGLIRSAGHLAGVKTLKNIIKTAVNIELEELTVYAFSTENWKRPHAEVDFLMHLFSEYLEKEKRELNEKNVKIHFLGRIDELPKSLIKQAHDAEEMMKDNTGLKFNVATNYGGQDEIVRAAQKIAARVLAGELKVEDIDSEIFEATLDTQGDPPVDLMIRTGGDFRVSNFMLWQSAYAEFWFTDTPFPDFKPEEFIEALTDFGNRDRRFGNIKNS